MARLFKMLLVFVLALPAAGWQPVHAQSLSQQLDPSQSAQPAPQALPVQVSVSGDVATAVVGDPAYPIADVTLTFDQPRNLGPSSLGLSASLLDPLDGVLQGRLPDPSLTSLQSALLMLLTIEPPADGGLQFRAVRVEVHTHLLTYTVGSSLRLFKAPLGGHFADITDEIAPGSVRARGTTGGFSQFLVLADLRESSAAVAQKIDALRTRIAALPATEQPPFDAYLQQAESAMAAGNYDIAIQSVERISSRARERAGVYLTDTWRAGGADNQAGDLIAGAATLKFSIAYLRDFGQ